MESALSYDKYPFLKALGLEKENPGVYAGGKWFGSGQWITSENPGDGSNIAKVQEGNMDDYAVALKSMQEAEVAWKSTPMPKRGEIVRLIGEELRKFKEPLGSLISLEVGKILGEGIGEVQEFIDICDMACGMSRKIGGQIMKSERKDHFMIENWNPLGIIGVISAFNFPNAVYGWNLAIALICGNCVMWKPSPTTPLTSIATMRIIENVFQANGVPSGVCTMLCSGVDVGKAMVADHNMKLISFTGSTWVGRTIAQEVAKRFGKCILELGGNNCSIVCEDANLDLAIRGCIFGAVGTSGQRCTSLRRLVIHETRYEEMKKRLLSAYKTISIGDQLDPKTLVGPVHNQMVVDIFTKSIKRIKEAGGNIICGGNVITERKGYYCEPTIVEISPDCEILQEELFCPILFIMKFKTFEEGVKINNSVPQGLSSSIFTNNMQTYFKWIGPNGSDCGIVNCNMGPSGAEIGGAFGGEKETGGGREAGSDAWKQYMKRQTCTVNYGKSLPLAQGITFDVQE